MRKLLLCGVCLLFFQNIFGQQNRNFNEIKNFYASNLKRLTDEYNREYESLSNDDQKAVLNFQYKEVLQKVDSMRNQAYVGALIRTKNEEELGKLQDSLQGQIYPEAYRRLKPASYPGGDQKLKGVLPYLIDFDSLNKNETKFTSLIHFVVEKDGSISNVDATGNDLLFNRQVEIAMYLLPEKFQPARYKNEVVRSSLQLPYTVLLK